MDRGTLESLFHESKTKYPKEHSLLQMVSHSHSQLYFAPKLKVSAEYRKPNNLTIVAVITVSWSGFQIDILLK